MSAPITEAHRELAQNIMFYHTPKGSATAQGVRDAAQLIADSEERAKESLLVAYDGVCKVRNRLTAERDQLLVYGENKTKWAARYLADAQNAKARAERAEADLATAKAIIASIEEDGTEEHNAAVRLRQELATERARLDWLDENAGDIHRYNSNRYIFIANQDLRTAIDAAMKEGA